MKIRPVPNSYSANTRRQIYINDIWSKYTQKERIEMSKLLKKDGPTFEEINIFETFELIKIWDNIKKSVGLNQ